MSIAEKLAQIAENEQKVFDAGREMGLSDGLFMGYQDGLVAGKKAQYDAFWDEYQEKGNRSYYDRAFGNLRWNDKTYKPKYPIRPLASYDSLFEGSRVTDTKVDIDFSRITQKTTVSRIFAYDSDLTTIRKLIVNENIVFDAWFPSCAKLTNLTVEGVIAQNGFDTHWSTKLSRASIESIVNALSTETSNLTVTFSRDAVNKAFETSEGANDGESTDEWAYMYIIARPNWYFSLG
jgi:hypothetical protein